MITGTADVVMCSMICRVESTRPPGVFSSINTASSWRRLASAMARAMYSSLMGWMVSSTTIFKISAEAGMHAKTMLSANNASRRMNEFFMMIAVRPRARFPGANSIFFLFPGAGVDFFGGGDYRGVIGRSSGGAPSGQVRAARNQARTSFVCHVRPRPLDEDQQAVAKADEEENVHE